MAFVKDRLVSLLNYKFAIPFLTTSLGCGIVGLIFWFSSKSSNQTKVKDNDTLITADTYSNEEKSSEYPATLITEDTSAFQDISVGYSAPSSSHQCTKPIQEDVGYIKVDENTEADEPSNQSTTVFIAQQQSINEEYISASSASENSDDVVENAEVDIPASSASSVNIDEVVETDDVGTTNATNSSEPSMEGEQDRLNEINEGTQNLGRERLAGHNISALREFHLEKLSQLNVGISSTCDYKHFGDEVIKSYYVGNQEDKQKLAGKINQCKLNIHGGGRPADFFFILLSTSQPDLSLTEFANVAGDIKRNDIVHYIQKIRLKDDNSLFKDLSEDDKETLAGMLNGPRKAGYNNYESMATRLNISDVEIKEIKQARQIPGDFCPTSKLFDILKAAMPHLNLQNIHDALIKIGRVDLANYLIETFGQ